MKRLQRYLEERKESQSAFARRLGVAQPTVWGWLNGTRVPETPMLLRLRATTGLTLDELMDLPAASRRRSRQEASEARVR